MQMANVVSSSHPPMTSKAPQPNVCWPSLLSPDPSSPCSMDSLHANPHNAAAETGSRSKTRSRASGSREKQERQVDKHASSSSSSSSSEDEMDQKVTLAYHFFFDPTSPRTRSCSNIRIAQCAKALTMKTAYYFVINAMTATTLTALIHHSRRFLR